MSHEIEIIDGKSVFKKEKEVFLQTIDNERNNKLKNPKNADINFVGNTNQMINMFSLLWKSMSYGVQSSERLPGIIEMNKETAA